MLKEIRRIKEWREELRQMKEEVKEGIKEQGKMMRNREHKKREEKWREEREEMKRCFEGLERKVIEKRERKRRRYQKGGIGDTEDGSVEGQIREGLERKIEMKERKGKRKNVIIRGK